MSPCAANRRLLFLVPLALLTLVGCGGPSADDLMKAQIAALNDLATALEKGASGPQMDALQERMASIGSQMRRLNPSRSEKERLKKKYQTNLRNAARRMAQAMSGRADAEKLDGMFGSGFPFQD